jgi:hypothetical protein
MFDEVAHLIKIGGGIRNGANVDKSSNPRSLLSSDGAKSSMGLPTFTSATISVEGTKITDFFMKVDTEPPKMSK